MNALCYSTVSILFFIFVIFCFSMLDSWLIGWLRLPAAVSCMVHGAITAMYVLENWGLLKDLETWRAEREASPKPSTLTQAGFIEKLLKQNALLEKKNMELEAKLAGPKRQGHLKRSWSLSIEPAAPRRERRWTSSSFPSARPLE